MGKQQIILLVFCIAIAGNTPATAEQGRVEEGKQARSFGEDLLEQGQPFLAATELVRAAASGDNSEGLYRSLLNCYQLSGEREKFDQALSSAAVLYPELKGIEWKIQSPATGTFLKYPEWIKWSVPLETRGGEFSRPVWAAGKLIYASVSPIHQKSVIRGYDVAKGKAAWQAGLNAGLEPYSYKSNTYQQRVPNELFRSDNLVVTAYTLWDVKEEGTSSSVRAVHNGLMALDAGTGNILWDKPWASPNDRHYRFSVFAGKYAAFNEGRLEAGDISTGMVLWSRACEGCSCDTCKASRENDLTAVQAGVVSLEAGRLHMNNWKGGELWASPGTLGTRFKGISVGGDAAYAISEGNTLYAFTLRGGRQLWKKRLSGEFAGFLGALSGVFVVTKDRKLFSLDERSGTVIWETVCNELPVAPMAIYKDLLLLPGPQFGLFAFNRNTGRAQWTCPARTSVPLVFAGSLIITKVEDDGIILGLRVPAGLKKMRSGIVSAARKQKDPLLAARLLVNLLKNDPSAEEAYLVLADRFKDRYYPAEVEDVLEKYQRFVHTPALRSALEGYLARQSYVRWTDVSNEYRVEGLASDSSRVYILRRHSLVALEKASGRQVWRLDQSAFGKSSCGENSDRLTLSAGILYLTAGESTLLALDSKTGEVIWKTVLPFNGGRCPAARSPLLANGKIYVGVTYTGFKGYEGHPCYNFCIVDAKTGTILHSVNIDNNGVFYNHDTSNSLKPAVSGEYAYYPTRDAGLYCVDTGSGTVKWHFPLDGETGTAPVPVSDPVIIGKKVYVLEASGFVNCLDSETGKTIWRKQVGKAAPILETLAAFGNNLCFCDNDTLWDINADTGNSVWGTHASLYNRPVALLRGALWTSTFTNAVQALDLKSGQVLWSRTFPVIRYSSWVQADEKYLYIVHGGNVTQILPFIWVD